MDPEPEWPAQDAALLMEHGASKNGSEFVARLQTMVENIPKSVPEGLENDRLAQFSVNPQDHDDPSLDVDGLLEEVLNSFLKGALGWGTEESMDDMVHWGMMGMSGILQFTRYFIEEHGVNEMLFEGKCQRTLHRCFYILTVSISLSPSMVYKWLLVVSKRSLVLHPCASPGRYHTLYLLFSHTCYQDPG